VPLSTLRLLPRGSLRMTRGQDGSLLLSRRTLSFPIPCRFIPAHTAFICGPILSTVCRQNARGQAQARALEAMRIRARGTMCRPPGLHIVRVAGCARSCRPPSLQYDGVFNGAEAGQRVNEPRSLTVAALSRGVSINADERRLKRSYRRSSALIGGHSESDNLLQHVCSQRESFDR